MQVTETHVDELTRHFRVALPAVEIDRKVDAKLNELAQSARLPGFRPGKVPVSLLRKRYGASVKHEAVEEAISESSRALISERGLRIATPPRVELAGSPNEGDLEYTMAIELLPEITPPDYGAIRLERLVAEVEEDEIERRVRRFAEAVGTETQVSESRPIEPNDIVVLDIVGPEDRWPFDAGHDRGIRVRAGHEAPLPGFADQLLGLSVGAQAVITVTLPTNAKREDLAGQEKSYEVEIKELRIQEPAEINDELARKGGWDDLENMRGWLRQQHESELKAYSRLRLKRALLDQLADVYAFDVPQGLWDREYRALVQQVVAESAAPQADAESSSEEAAHVHDEHCTHDHDAESEHSHGDGEQPEANEHADLEVTLPSEKRDEYRALAARRVRLGLVLAEIGRINNIRVTEEELGKAMVAQARRFPGQEQAMLEYLRKHPQAQEAVAAPVLEDKVIDFILEMAQVDERSVPAAELLRDIDADTTSA